MSQKARNKKFGAFIRGENFKFDDGGKVVAYGFYVTRLVEARNIATAERRAIQLIRGDAKLNSRLLNSEDDSPMLYVEKLAELSSWGGLKPPGTGFAFFKEVKSRKKKGKMNKNWREENKRSERRKGRERK